ncbi:MAG: YqgE/AlgH family protein [Chromatiales bacterium]|nr:YqgE/AlgH family protein [Chromatiales bacterium]
MSDHTSLTGHLLIAMPSMQDPNFHQTVTFICEHSPQGALGIVINRPMDLELGSLLEQLSLSSPDNQRARQPVLAGGPVQQERGFVLHEAGTQYEATVNIDDRLAVTTSRDILAALASGEGPGQAIVALGYAGWAAGQLELELSANAWLSVPATSALLFDTPFQERWTAAARLLGIELSQLSPEAGHA